MIVEVLDDQPAEHDPDPAAGAEDRGDDADAPRVEPGQWPRMLELMLDALEARP